MKKSLAELVDELGITNMKIFSLVDLVQTNKHSKEDAFKLQKLNSYRSELKNAISEWAAERTEGKV